MNPPTLRIDELSLRVPGLNPRDAQRFAEQVAQQLAAQLPGTLAPRQIGTLQLKLKSPQGSRSELPTTIARSLARKIT